MDKNFVLKGFGSAAIHAGHEQDPQYAHLTPVYASSTYVYDTAEQCFSEPGTFANSKPIKIKAAITSIRVIRVFKIVL